MYILSSLNYSYYWYETRTSRYSNRYQSNTTTMADAKNVSSVLEENAVHLATRH
jgi:hypothetical protein